LKLALEQEIKIKLELEENSGATIKRLKEETERAKRCQKQAEESSKEIRKKAEGFVSQLEALQEDKTRLESLLEATEKKNAVQSNQGVQACAHQNLQSELEQLRQNSSEWEKQKEANAAEIERLQRKLGNLNVQYGCLKVDVDRGEIEYKKLNKNLQDRLDFEKERNHKLTLQVRQMQTERMETTVLNPRENYVDKGMNTESNSSVACTGWLYGSGSLKEIQLDQLEFRVQHLQRLKTKLEAERDFYIKRGCDWKAKANWYKEILIDNKLTFPTDEEILSKPKGPGAEKKAAAQAEKENQILEDFDLCLDKVKPTPDYRLPCN